MNKITADQILDTYEEIQRQRGVALLSTGNIDRKKIKDAIADVFSVDEKRKKYRHTRLSDMASRLCFLLVEKAPFPDCNRLTAMAAMFTLLEVNNIRLTLSAEDVNHLYRGLGEGMEQWEIKDWLRSRPGTSGTF